MKTRHDKVAQHLELVAEMERAIRGLKFWPKDWLIRVQLVRKRVSYEFRTPRHRRCGGLMTKKPRTNQLTLRLHENWMEKVYEKGLAVVCGRMVLYAGPAAIPEGADGCWSVSAIAYSQGRPIDCYSPFVVSYGGTFALAASPAVGMDMLIARASSILRGEDPDVPF